MCSVTGCTNTEIEAKGLCKKHYTRMYRNGSVEGMDGFVTYERVRNGKRQVVRRRVRTNEIGWARHPLYKQWTAMRRRCHEPKAQNYRWYGGRGIAVCEGWRNDFLVFRDWALSSGWEKGFELDRIDNDCGYEPSNCRWVPKIDNLANRRGYLSESVQEQLKQVAQERGVSVTALIQEAVESYLSPSVDRR